MIVALFIGMNEESLYLLSKCLVRRKKYAVMHFKGVFNGKIIKSIIIEDKYHYLVKKKEYLLKLSVIEVNNSNLYCKLIKQKELFFD